MLSVLQAGLRLPPSWLGWEVGLAAALYGLESLQLVFEAVVWLYQSDWSLLLPGL